MWQSNYGSMNNQSNKVLMSSVNAVNDDDEESLLPQKSHSSGLNVRNSIELPFKNMYYTMGIMFSLIILITILAFDTASGQAIVLEVLDIFKSFESRNPTRTTMPISDIILSAENEYGMFSAPYPWLKDGVLVEPYKTTTLRLSNIPDDAVVYWTITNSDYSSYHIAQDSIDIVIKDLGIYKLQVEFVVGKQVIGMLSKNIYVKYVKRELRSLTVDDREKFLDAAAMMWSLSTEEGRKKYGERYTSIHTFVKEHALASNDIQCDSYHDGSGFITHHFALTNSFDASLRAIDPMVTLHYWDFSIEGQAIEDANEIPSYLLKISPVFTGTWFGSIDANDHIKDSRWAHRNMTMIDDSIGADVRPNSYGYVRSYWNNNNDREIVRRLFDVCGYEAVNKRIPSCSSHYDLLQSPSLAQFQLLAPGVGHGPMHVHIGGMGGECESAMRQFIDRWKDILYADMTMEEVTRLGIDITAWTYGFKSPRLQVFQENILGEYFHFYRGLWRSHICSRDRSKQLLQCPESCSQSMSLDECKCSIPSLTDDYHDIENVFYCIVDSNARDMFTTLFSREFITDLVLTISTTSLYEGEMIESASPADITFWTIHPTLERLLMAKRLSDVTLMTPSSPISKWISIDGSNEEWLSFSMYSYKAGDVPTMSPAGYICYGHDKDDIVLPSHLPLLGDFGMYADKDSDGNVSNWEYFIASNPNDPNGLDYVYDTFTWRHCDHLDL